MAKNNRGKNLYSLPARGRGTCPVCQRTGIKIIREAKIDEQTLKVCKECFKTEENKKG